MVKNHIKSILHSNANHPSLGIFLFTLSMLLLPVIDAMAKLLIMDNFSVLQISAARFLFAGIIIALIILVSKQNIIHMFTQNILPKIYISIGVIGLTIGFYLSLLYTSVSISLAIVFVAPLLTIILSHLFLGEKMTRLNIIACLIGFGGVIFIIKPATSSFNLGACFALIAALSWSSISLISRYHGKNLSAKQTQCFASLLSVIVYVVAFWLINPNAELLPSEISFWYITAVMGIMSAVLYIAVQIAHSYAKASTLAPIQYVEIISGLLLDLVLFNLIPDTYSWIGINIVIISGVFVWYNNKTQNKT